MPLKQQLFLFEPPYCGGLGQHARDVQQQCNTIAVLSLIN